MKTKKLQIIESMIKTDETLTQSGIPADSAAVGEAITESIEDVVYAEEDSSDVASIPLNADTLGGRPASDYATESFVTNKIAEAQLGGGSGEIDLSGYATKDELNIINNKIPTTAEQVGARPNTWLPSLSDINAAPASHLDDKNNPHGMTLEQLGAAPAGFGLGSEFGKACSDCDLALENGYYQIGASTEHRPDGMSTRCWMQVISYGSTYKTQICYSSSKAIKIREMNDGTWSDWVDWSPSAFAPAGYGLGLASGKFVDDCNKATVFGLYSVNYATANNPLNAYGALLVLPHNETEKCQILTSSYTKGVVIRYETGGTWGEWEWVNPPMALGVEYRTTERWNGAIKYTKHIYIGQLADTGNKVVSLGIPYNKIVTIDIYGSDINGLIRQKFPLTKNGAIIADAFVNSVGELVIGSYANNMSWEAYAIITYVK